MSIQLPHWRVKAESSEGAGLQGKILTNHKALNVDADAGKITFENGNVATADLIIAADNIRVGRSPSVK